MTSAEEVSIKEGLLRVKFAAHWKGTVDKILTTQEDMVKYLKLGQKLCDALYLMEMEGAAPVVPGDGKVGGNGSCILTIDDKELLIVSKSGKYPGKMNVHTDLCILENFNKEEWSVDYYSANQDILPTSDSPMHYTVLTLKKHFDWSEYPTAALHGHALETEEKAQLANIPCSLEETLFSTPPDTHALVSLIGSHPYPKDNVYIRKNHGFFLLGKDIENCSDVFKEKVLPFSNIQKS